MTELVERRREWRRATSEKLIEALRLLGWNDPIPDWLTPAEPIPFMLLGQVALSLRYAAVAEDEAGVESALGLLVRPPATSEIPWPLVEGSYLSWHSSKKYESPLGLLTPEALDRPVDVEPNYLASVMELLDRGDPQGYAADSIGLVVLLKRQPRYGMTTSYSLLGVPGTIYADVTPSPLRFAEALLHESAHCWLNEQLEAWGESLPDEPKWHSVWKGIDRPAYGILHAIFAFSLLTSFFARHGKSEHEDQAYCRARWKIEHENLRTSEKAFRAASRHLKSGALASRLSRELERALDAV